MSWGCVQEVAAQEVAAQEVAAQEGTEEPSPGGGASPSYRLRRCDEEHGQIPCSESIGQPALGSIKRPSTEHFQNGWLRDLHPLNRGPSTEIGHNEMNAHCETREM